MIILLFDCPPPPPPLPAPLHPLIIPYTAKPSVHSTAKIITTIVCHTHTHTPMQSVPRTCQLPHLSPTLSPLFSPPLGSLSPFLSVFVSAPIDIRYLAGGIHYRRGKIDGKRRVIFTTYTDSMLYSRLLILLIQLLSAGQHTHTNAASVV